MWVLILSDGASLTEQIYICMYIYFLVVIIITIFTLDGHLNGWAYVGFLSISKMELV